MIRSDLAAPMTRTRRYLVALLLVAASLVLRLSLQSWLGDKVPFLPFFPAIMLASSYGGFGPGIAATSASAALALFFFMPPMGSFAISDPADGVPVVLFAVTGAGIAWFSHGLRRAEAQREVAARVGSARAQELQTILDTAVDGIIVIDTQGRIETFNHGAERLFGYRASEVVGGNVNVLMPSPDHERHDGYLARYLSTGEARIIGLGREVRGRRRDGSVFPLHLSVGEMTIGGVRKFTGMLHDLSERTEIERRLREQASLARLGEMAAVVAHEVKNPLAGIRGAIQVIGGRLPADSADRRITGEIVARIDALDAMMKDLLLFARTPTPQPQHIDVVWLLARTAELLREDPLLRDVNVRIEGAAPPTMADASLLQIVFHNLLVNGAQAMQGRGDIFVSVDGAGGTCRIQFADQGPGIPSEIREKVFTPFFTTKTRGSGLGLLTCRRLIEAHRGTLAIDCPPEGGTTVTVMLPAAG
jgi:two-component system sensor kinase FixL